MLADPRVLFLGHGAERTGPPVFLLRLQRWLAENGAPSHETVLVRGGDLLPELERLGPVTVLDPRWTVPRIAEAGARRVGAEAAGRRVRLARRRARLRSLGAADVVYLNS